MSAAEAAQPPAEGVDDPETEAEPAIPLAALNEVTIKRGITALLKALFERASSESEHPEGKSTPGALAIRSEKTGTAADGSLVGLVHEILLGPRWRLSPRKMWDIVRAWIPKTEPEHWKLGSASNLINLTIEKRQFAVKAILTELVEKELSMAAALTDFGTSDDTQIACTRLVAAAADAQPAAAAVALAAATVPVAAARRRRRRRPRHVRYPARRRPRPRRRLRCPDRPRPRPRRHLPSPSPPPPVPRPAPPSPLPTSPPLPPQLCGVWASGVVLTFCVPNHASQGVGRR